MKRIFLKFATLLVLITAVFLLQDNVKVKAAASCWEAAYSKWQGCENGYSAIKYDHIYVESNCATQANNACPNDPYPSSCYVTQYNACVTADQSRYDNRGNTYNNCMGSEGTGSTCVEQLSGTCSLANDRAATCSNLYSGSEDYEAFDKCRAESGIDRCQ
jgi:hypothetical protein